MNLVNENQFREKVSKVLAEKNAGDSVIKLANTPSSPMYFVQLRKSVNDNYEKYRDELSEYNFTQFKDDVFNIFKSYKLELDKVEKDNYNDTYAKYGLLLDEVCKKYGVSLRN